MVRGLIHRQKTNNIIYKTDEQIEMLREACLLVCKVLTYVGETQEYLFPTDLVCVRYT